MQDIGQTLRESRERLGLTLEEVERSIRIRAQRLESIEEGDFDSLPSIAQARGFLHNYAEFLGLDTEAILEKYTEALESPASRSRQRLRGRRLESRPSVEIRSSRPRWLSIDLLIAAVVTLAIMAVLIWGGSRVFTSLDSDTSGTEVMIAELGTTPTTESTATLIPPPDPSDLNFVTPEPIPPTATQPILLGFVDSIQILLRTESRSWVRVVVDGEVVLVDRLAPGEEFEFNGEAAVEVSTGNGGGIRIFYNGLDQGLMGEVGQAVIRVWNLEGLATPTPTQTLTPTTTPEVTETPTPTPSPTSTP